MQLEEVDIAFDSCLPPSEMPLDCNSAFQFKEFSLLLSVFLEHELLDYCTGAALP
jgi:hypothetical protein